MSTRIAPTLGSPQRLTAVSSTRLMDTPAEPEFDRISHLVATALHAPMAAVTLIDDTRQFFKSFVGFPKSFRASREVPIEESICRYVAGRGQRLAVGNTSQHRWLRRSTFVERFGMLAYAGAPLRIGEGDVIGSIFAADTAPRQWTRAELRALDELASFAVEAMLRRLPGGSDPAAVLGAGSAAVGEFLARGGGFQTLVQQSIVGIAVMRGGRIRYANPTFAAIFGYTEDEVLELRSVLELVVEEDRQIVAESLRHKVDGDLDSQHFRFRGRTKDGQTVHVEVHGRSVSIGGAPAFLGVLLDVTSGVLAEEALRKSEERYRRFFDEDLTGDLITTADGRVVASNPAFARMLGYESVEAVLGMDAPGFFASPEAYAQWLDSVRRRRRIELLETEVLRQDGQLIHVLENVVGTLDQAGDLQEVRRYMFDITKRKRAEEALRRSEEQFRTLIENAWDIVHVIDGDGLLRYISPSVQQVLGFTPKEMVGKRFGDFIHPEDQLLAGRESDPETASLESDGFLEIRLRHRSDGWRTVEIRNRPLIDQDGKPIAIVYAHDVTERRQMEEALRRNEERFRLASRATNDVLREWDVERGEIIWSESTAKALRYPRHQLGSSIEWWIDRIHADERERVIGDLYRVVEGAAGEVWSGEYRFLRGDGVYAAILDRSYVVRDDRGGPMRVIGSMMDITDRRRAEESHRLMARVSAILDSSLDPADTLPALTRSVIPALADFCVVDLIENGLLRRAALAHSNPADERLLDDVPPQDLNGGGMGDPICKVALTREPLLISRVAERFYRSMEADSETSRRFRALQVQSLIVTPMVVHDDLLGVLTLAITGAGRSFGPMDLLLAEDLARRTALAFESARLYARAQQAIFDRERILGVVSHDLRNPLHTITISAEQILDMQAERRTENLNFLEIILRAASQMNHMISDLMDLSSIDSGRLSMAPARGDVAALLNEVCESFEPLARQRGIELRCDSDPDMGVAWLDSDRILRVFSNLLGNALKFTPTGGTITISAEHRDGFVQFSVRDTGPGISPEEQPNVFDRYWQARKDDRRGSGLGLSIAKGIVEAHGGRIWIESLPGMGATFFFTVPEAEAEAVA